MVSCGFVAISVFCEILSLEFSLIEDESNLRRNGGFCDYGVFGGKLPFFEYDDFGIGSVFAVFAYEDVVLVAGDSEAAAFGVLLFDLVAPVACVVV